ncbi:hypothetical protein STRDD11_00264 [Streptococcus sp. DD11]|uniref:DUF554 domain-containing protein n=1 Tax=Streptococcus sp. DD11 TaxID=1777879 RepID=UPI00079CB454|nr:DUF554 domain-containing protein [Streptococcus sp. DD11]KXT85726.1 hypothetical protein STRDD11_00264 [Streptococcus sp. DD11]
MFGLGTLVNAAGVVAGGFLGLLIGSRLPHGLQDSLMKATGLAVLFLGLAGALEQMLQVSQGQLVSRGSMLVIISLTVGTLIGEALNIEQAFEDFGKWLKRVTKNERDTTFVDAFVTASLTICIGAMAVVGSIQDGLRGDYSILLAKAVLDAIIVLILTVSKGKGALFAAVPILLIQGSLTLLAHFLAPIMTAAALDNLSMIGSILIFCVGINLIWGKLLKVANMLPALILAVMLTFLPFFG